MVLYEWLTGFRLFTGDSEVAVLRSITEGKIYAPSYFKADIPRGGRGDPDEGAGEGPREALPDRLGDAVRHRPRSSAQYEFTPSNIHLSNFLKQLFHDELEEERARLTRASDTLATDDAGRRGGRALRLHLDDSRPEGAGVGRRAQRAHAGGAGPGRAAWLAEVPLMPRVRLTLEYDGTDFVGWQRQPNGRSVQEVLEAALAELLGAPVTAAAAGRTDAGVHALGQVVAFDAPRALPVKAYVRGLRRSCPRTSR